MATREWTWIVWDVDGDPDCLQKDTDGARFGYYHEGQAIVGCDPEDAESVEAGLRVAGANPRNRREDRYSVPDYVPLSPEERYGQW